MKSEVIESRNGERGTVFRRAVFIAVIATFCMLVMAACAPHQSDEDDGGIRIYQLLPVAKSSRLVRTAGAGTGEMIALINAGKQNRSLAGWRLESAEGQAVLPDTKLQPGEVLYLANDAIYFRQYWGRAPQLEYGADTDQAVANAHTSAQHPLVLKDEGDVVRLLDDRGKLVDMIVYGNIGNPPAPWAGPPVHLVNSFPLTPANQVITRRRSANGLLLEPREESWSGGTERMPERVWFAGQSDFPVRSVTAPVALIAASAPDNAGPVLFDLIDGARKSVRLVGYQYTARELTDRLVAAVRRGVKVQVAIERNPGGSDMFESDKEAHALLHQGGVEVLYHYHFDGTLSERMNPLHSKYAIVDDEAVLVSTGNWINSVYSSDSSCGNREWIAVIRGNAEVVRLFREVWDFDIASGAPDIRPYDATLDRPLAPAPYDAGPCVPYTPVKPQPLRTSGEATVTRILSPDNTLDRQDGFLALLRSAQHELLINANYIYKWWGAASATENMTRYPQPYLQEIVAAARRGVDVKVLLDRRNLNAASLRDNHYVVAYLNELGAKEGLRLQARLVNMDRSGIGRTFHNKALVVDDAVVISSINGSENSFRYAREMAITIAGVPAFTSYYRDLFVHDWEASTSPNYPWNVRATPRHTGTFIDWSANAELDVTGYEIYFKSDEAAPWVKVGQTERPGFEDSHMHGFWGVVAVNRSGLRSQYAQVNR